MGELRAYALPVAELRGVPGATGARRARFEALARDGLAPAPPTTRNRLGPLYRRVPGARVLRDDDPTPADLATFLDGGPVAPGRAAATWRLVEVFAAALARRSTAADVLPDGLLAPLGLPVPPVDGWVAGWCSPAAAVAVPDLRAWSGTLPDGLDVVVLGRSA